MAQCMEEKSAVYPRHPESLGICPLGCRGKPSTESWPHEAHWNLLVGKVRWETSLWVSGETARKGCHALVTATRHRNLLRKNTHQNQDEESFCLQVPSSAPAEKALHEARWQGEND